jgi:hypothetical protein
MSEKSQSICPISLSSNFITTQVKTINVALSGLEWMAASRSQGKKNSMTGETLPLSVAITQETTMLQEKKDQALGQSQPEYRRFLYLHKHHH